MDLLMFMLLDCHVALCAPRNDVLTVILRSEDKSRHPESEASHVILRSEASHVILRSEAT